MKKIIIIITMLIVAIGTSSIIYINQNNGKDDQFRFAKLTRGDLENTISSTGTIEAMSSVEIGTQVSGTIAELYADFNDQVSEGQLLAVLDTTVLKAAVIEAEASVEQSQAQLDQANADYNRNLPLFEKGYLSESEFLSYKTNLQTQKALMRSANAKLERAIQNVSYAIIRSPIDGTVIQRNIEEGQTVAASLSAPVLFIIAEDLSRMKIQALVDESDIGQIKEGQSVHFSVLAYPDETFEGTVQQVRLLPETVQNVVNYTVVIDARNENNHLLPGMTATVDFIIEQRKDVWLISGSALKFKPTEEMLSLLHRKIESSRGGNQAMKKTQDNSELRRQLPDSLRKPPFMPAGQLDSMAARLWFLDDKGELAVKHVKTGISDGRLTEITSAENLREGMEFIIGTSKSSATSSEGASSSTQNHRPGPPGFGRL